MPAPRQPYGKGFVIRLKEDKETFAELIGEVVQEYVGEIPAIEIIGVLETAKACVIKQAVEELRDGE